MGSARWAARGEAAFRRDAAHALSTPLGSLFLQAELIEHFLGQGKVAQARDAVATLLSDFEAYGQRFRSVFTALEDIAEDGEGGSDVPTCLARALSELGEVSAQIVYRGPPARVGMPSSALTALLRRLAMLARALEPARVAIVEATKAKGECRISLLVEDGAASGPDEPTFDSPCGLDLRVSAEIAARYGGSVRAGGAAGVLAVVVLPLDNAG